VFWVAGLFLSVSGFGFSFVGFGFRVMRKPPYSRVPDSCPFFSCFVFRVSGSRFLVSGFWFLVSSFGFLVSGSGFRGLHLALARERQGPTRPPDSGGHVTNLVLQKAKMVT